MATDLAPDQPLGNANPPGSSIHDAQTAGHYFEAFSPVPRWEELSAWPVDVFCLCNLVLDHTEGYRFVVAPPPGRRWPPAVDWNDQVALAAQQWRAVCGQPGGRLPDLVRRCWDLVARSRDVPLANIRSGGAWELCEALLTLHAVADEACAGLAAVEPPAAGSFEARAWALLAAHGSLAHVPPSRVRIVPKTNLAASGITIRSLSRYLALCYESVELRWRRVESQISTRGWGSDRDYQVLLVPWPLTVEASDFRPVPTPLGNMDPQFFRFFEFAPRRSLPPGYLSSLLDAAAREKAHVDAVVLPEGAVRRHELRGLEHALAEHGATFLVVGVREPPSGGAFGRNYLHFGVRTDSGWDRYEQDKHHRWCLDGSQIRQYHLTRSLDPGKLWWEAIDIPARTLHVIDVGGGATTAPLVCEDLARMDEVADLVRRIGPSMVIAVLLDGPQLATRWPCRYASVLAAEPGSAVLTLTSSGMATRSRPAGMRPSRVVALWNDSTHGLHEIELDAGADAILITPSVELKRVWTADGRCHPNVPALALTDVRQLRVTGGRRRAPRRR